MKWASHPGISLAKARAQERDQGVGRAVPQEHGHLEGLEVQAPVVADQHQVVVGAGGSLAEGLHHLQLRARIVLARFEDAAVPCAQLREHLFLLCHHFSFIRLAWLFGGSFPHWPGIQGHEDPAATAACNGPGRTPAGCRGTCFPVAHGLRRAAAADQGGRAHAPGQAQGAGQREGAAAGAARHVEAVQAQLVGQLRDVIGPVADGASRVRGRTGRSRGVPASARGNRATRPIRPSPGRSSGASPGVPWNSISGMPSGRPYSANPSRRPSRRVIVLVRCARRPCRQAQYVKVIHIYIFSGLVYACRHDSRIPPNARRSRNAAGARCRACWRRPSGRWTSRAWRTPRSRASRARPRCRRPRSTGASRTSRRCCGRLSCTCWSAATRPIASTWRACSGTVPWTGGARVDRPVVRAVPRHPTDAGDGAFPGQR